MLAVQSAGSLLPALHVWTWPSSATWGWALAIALCGTYSHYCMARALLYADASVVIPMDFLRVPLTALMGWLIYSERLDAFTVIGAALILAGNFLNLRPANPAPARAGS
jgi:drug/metabolite transporter (DMT)-like permease